VFRSILAIAVAGVLLVSNVAPAQEESPSLRFVVLGDTRGSGAAINRTVMEGLFELILELDPPAQFVLVTGDLVRGSDDLDLLAQQFQQWLEVAEPLYASDMYGQKVYPAVGNHDMAGLAGIAVWQEMFDYLPANGPAGDERMTYSFDVGPCHFVVVNTEHPQRPHRTDLDWLVEDLASSDKPMKFVFGHDPAYPIANHIGSSLDRFPLDRDQFWQILGDFNVQAYFCGHEHLYDHWVYDGVHQIITGGGGAPINLLEPGGFYHFCVVDVTESDGKVQVIDIGGQVRDEFLLSDTEVDPDARNGQDSGLWFLLAMLPCLLLILLPALAVASLGWSLVERNK